MNPWGAEPRTRKPYRKAAPEEGGEAPAGADDSGIVPLLSKTDTVAARAESMQPMVEHVMLGATRPRLVVSNEAMRKIVEIEGSSALIGRSMDVADEVTIVLDHPAVDPTHARIDFKNSRWWLESLRTTNKTFIGRNLLAEGKLRNSGFVRQEDITLDDFLASRFGRNYVHEADDARNGIG